jgi:hypothetical protein
METLEQLQAAAAVAAPELTAFLETDIDALLASAPSALESIPQAALATIFAAEYPLGVELDAIPRLTAAPTFTIMT